MPIRQSPSSITYGLSSDVTPSESSSSHEVLPAVKMLIGDWHVDELGHIDAGGVGHQFTDGIPAVRCCSSQGPTTCSLSDAGEP